MVAKNTVSAIMTCMTNTLKNPILLKKSETFKEFYTSKKEALEVATKIYMLNKAA